MSKKELSSETKVLINASPKEIWTVLTESDFTKKYMFNCAVNTSWKVGDDITWKGHYEGYDAFQKGKVLAFEPYKLIKYSTLDPNWMEEKDENYIHVSYVLDESDSHTELKVVNETFDGSDERMQHIVAGWDQVLDKIKTLAEEIA